MTKTIALPTGVSEKDALYPSNKGKDVADYTLGQHGVLNLYYTEAVGWCVTTLPIGGKTSQYPDRTYAISIKDKKSVRIGGGPHVTRVVTIYLRKDNKAHKALADLYLEGMTRAGTIRDRIGSRRAQGQEMRAQGRRSWRWDD